MEINQSGQQREKQILKNVSNIQDILDIIKHPNWHIIVVPEGEEREKGIKEVFEELMAENLPNLKTGNRYPRTGLTEGPKQNELKQTYT